MIPHILGLADQMERLPEVLRAVADVIAAKDAEIARLRARLDEIAGDAWEADLARMEGEIVGKVVSLRGVRK